MGTKEFIHQMAFKGWYSFPGFVDGTLLNELRYGLEVSYRKCRQVQKKNGIENAKNTAHHIVADAKAFTDYLIKFEELDTYVEAYFGGKYILNSFGGNILKKEPSYASKIHRDIRSYSGDIPLMLNTIVFLDDFTKDNGATWLMEAGHLVRSKPSQEEFDEHKFQILGKAGTVVMWNSNLWHQAGENKTDKPRRSITPEFSRPFMKQGFDYPRAFGYHMADSLPPYLRQVLGYNSRTPMNLDHWYAPPGKRFYQEDQG